MTNPGPRPDSRQRLLFWLAWLICPLLAGADDFSGSNWSMKPDPQGQPLPSPTSKDFSIPFPANFGGGGEVAYPATPSVFAVIGKNTFDNDQRQVWDLSTKKQVGTIKGQIGLDDKTIALSPDGAYLAGKQTFRKSVEVRATKTGKMAQSFDVESPFVDFVEFAGPGRIVYGRLQDKKLEVAEVKSGDKVCDLALMKEADKEAVAISPGGKYLAVASANDGALRAYDLADGKLVGEAQTPKVKGLTARCVGLAFAPDGSELAGLFESFRTFRLVIWSVLDGKMTADFDFGKEIQRPNFYASQGVVWFPDRSALLVLGHAIVVRGAGKKVWDLPFDGQDLKPSRRGFLDADHALVVSSRPTMALKTYALPRDKIAEAVKIVQAGGNASDAALPPLQPTDASGAKVVDLAGAPGAWSVAPKPFATPSKRLTARPVPLKAKADEARALLFPGGGSTQVVVVGTPQQLGQPNPTEGQTRWVERIDLAGGKVLGKLDLPNVVDPIAVSPDGSALLLREARAKDRLDVISALDGKPVVGWRPYDKASPDAKGVAWAAFLDPGRVVSLSTGGTLALWALPKCRAVYLADDAFVGQPALSPDRTLIAGFDGKTLRVLDAETGARKGEAPGPTGLGQRVELKALAFRPDGLEVAGLFQGGTIARWDLKAGKLLGQFAVGSPLAGNSLVWAGEEHLLLDGRLLVDLGSKRVVWEYSGGSAGGRGPDGRRWLVVRGGAGDESGRLASLDAPDPSVERAEALLADAKAPAVIRPGSRVSLQLNLNGPPKDPQGYRQALADAIGAKLKQAGLTVVEDGAPAKGPNPSLKVSFARVIGPDARLVIDAKEVDTGKTIQYRRIGRGRGEIQVVKLIDLSCSMTLVDSAGTVSWMPAQVIPMQPFGFVLRMPAGETDPEVYLKKLQWDKVKAWATTAGPPYFVAREGNTVIRLPGWTDLNAEFAQ